MFARPITPRGAALALPFALLLGLAACGGAGTSDSPTDSPPAETASADPSPTPVAVDIVEEFVAKAEKASTFISDLSGTVRIGDVEGEISGALEVVGPDVHTLTAIAFPGMPTSETESTSVDGVTYTRTADRFWLQVAGGTGGTSSDPISSALADSDALEVVGTEQHAGITLTRIESSRPADIGPEILGLTDPTIADLEGEVAFLAEEDGTPAGIVFAASWTQGPPEARVVGEFQLRYLVVDRVVTIEAPKDAWTVYESADFGYSMGHPVSWDVRHEPADADYDESDLYVGPEEGEVQVYLYTDLSDVMANQWFRESQAVLAEEYGTQPEVVSTFALADGLEVQVLALEFTDGAEKYFFQQAVVFAGDVAWDLDWYSFVGSEEDDRARFLQFVNSFARATD